MDIKPPPKRPRPTPPSRPKRDELPFVETPMIKQEQPKTGWGRRQWTTFALVGAALMLVAATISVGFWYAWAIQPKSSEEHQVRVVVAPGETVASIATTLHDHDLIKSRLAFTVHTQVTGMRTKLQAGGYVLSPTQSVSEIVEHLTTGSTDEFDITIPPGLTLDELKKRFLEDGFSEQEIASAFNANYNHPLLASRPPGATLEGYIFPETYKMNANQPLEKLLERSFDELYDGLQEKGYLEAIAGRNLTIHQAVTMASIIQKEVSDGADQAQVAQVFHKRLAENIPLQSDPTFIYAARKMGVKPSTQLDSPYNTYVYKGLPPGPISNFNFSAIEAVVAPSPGDYLYFVADRQGVTHFSKTLKEHEAKVDRFCTDHCTDF